MGLKLNGIKQIMKSVTSRPITIRSIACMTRSTEDFIRDITEAAVKLLDEQNELRKLQGLREKVRLSEEEIKGVIERILSKET